MTVHAPASIPADRINRITTLAFYWADIEAHARAAYPGLAQDFDKVERVLVFDEAIDSRSGMAAGDATAVAAEAGVEYESDIEFFAFYVIEPKPGDWTVWRRLTRSRRTIDDIIGHVLEARQASGYIVGPVIGGGGMFLGGLATGTPLAVCRRPSAGADPYILRYQQELTPAEALLYDAIVDREIDFSSQVSLRVAGAIYSVDFLFHARNGMALAVEIDGDDGHSEFERRRAYERLRALESAGYRVLRFTNPEVRHDAERCVDTIRKRLFDLTRFGR